MLQWCQSKTKKKEIKFRFAFESKKWYFIMISHVYHFFRPSEVDAIFFFDSIGFYTYQGY